MAYATVAQVRAHLGYQDTFTADDEMIRGALAAAIEAVDAYCGRTFDAPGESETTRIFNGGTTRCPIDDAATVTLVEESYDRQSWTEIADTAWWAEPANSLPIKVLVGSLPFSRFVRVTGTWGHASVPDSVARATIMLAAKLHKRKDSATGVEGFADFGVVRISQRMDPDVAMLLDPLRRADVVFGIA